MKNPKPEQNHAAQAVGIQLCEELEAAESRSETERLREEVEWLNHELRREHEMYVRNLADFDSYRRRAERERAQAAQEGKRDLILPLLEIMDDLDQALLRSHDNPQSLAVGLRAILRRLEGLLAAEGVTTFESLGKYFNPLLHEAVGAVDGGGGEPGTVIEEVSRGWRLGDDLLRPARVRVAQ